MGWIIAIVILFALRKPAAGGTASAGFGTANPGTGVLNPAPSTGFRPQNYAPFAGSPTPVDLGAPANTDAELVVPLAAPGRILPNGQAATGAFVPIETVQDTFVASNSSLPSPVPLQVPGNYTIGTHTPITGTVFSAAPIEEPDIPLVIGPTIQGAQKPLMQAAPQSELQGGRVWDM